MMEECGQRLQRIVDGFEQYRPILTAIGDETRQLILLVFLESNLSGIRVGEIAEKAHLTRPSVSHHLKILKASGIVGMKKEGTKNYYYLNVDAAQWEAFIRFIQMIYDSCTHLSI